MSSLPTDPRSWSFDDLVTKYEEILEKSNKQHVHILALEAKEVEYHNKNLAIALRNVELAAEAEQLQKDLYVKNEDIKELQHSHGIEIEDLRDQLQYPAVVEGTQNHVDLVQQLLDQIETLQARLNDVEFTDGYTNQIEMLQDRIKSLEAALHTAQNPPAHEVTPSQENVVASLKRQIADMQAEIDVRTSPTRQTSSQQILELEKKIKASREDYDNLWAKFDRSEEKLQQCGEQRQKLEDEVRDKKNHIEHLQGQLKKLSIEKEGNCQRKCEVLEEKLGRLVENVRWYAKSFDETIEEIVGDENDGEDDGEDGNEDEGENEDGSDKVHGGMRSAV